MFLRVCVCVVCFGSGVFRRNARLSHARLSDDLHPRHDQMLTRFTPGFAFIFLYDCTARTPSCCSLLLNKEDLALFHPAVPKYLIPAVRVPHPDSTASLLFGCTSIPSGLYRITAP